MTKKEHVAALIFKLVPFLLKKGKKYVLKFSKDAFVGEEKERTFFSLHASRNDFDWTRMTAADPGLIIHTYYRVSGRKL